MENPAGTSHGTQQREGAQRTLSDKRWTLPPLQLFPFVPIFTSSLSSQHCPVLLPDSFPSFPPPNVFSLLIFLFSSLLAAKAPLQCTKCSSLEGNTCSQEDSRGQAVSQGWPACFQIPLSPESAPGQGEPRSHSSALAAVAF